MHISDDFISQMMIVATLKENVCLSPLARLYNTDYEMTYLLVPEKTGDRGSFFLMNSMILSSLLAVWAGNSGAEGNRARSSSASDTGQFNNSDTR